MTKRYRRSLYGLVALLLVLHLASLGLVGSSLFSTRAWDVKRLEGVLPLLEGLELHAYRNQTWCKNLLYARGAFSDNERSTCNLFDEAAAPFSAESRQAFGRVARALALRQVNVRWLSHGYDMYGVMTTEFDLGCLFCSRPRYVYAPDYGQLPPDEPHELWYTPINKDWYLVEEDWN